MQPSSLNNTIGCPNFKGALHRGTMRLRGHNLQGGTYDIAFTVADFRKSGGRLVIGRKNDLRQLCLPHDSISRQDATLSLQGGRIYLEDWNSVNGTKVNGRKLIVGDSPVTQQAGDRFTLGEVVLIFEAT